MYILLPIICFIAGLATGIIICNILNKRLDKSSLYEEQIRALKEEMQARAKHQQEEMQANARRQQEALESQAKRQEEAMHRREDDLRRESVAQFKALAADLLKEHAGELKQTNSEQIIAILKPLAENIEGFRKAVTESYVNENASRKSLTDQIQQLMELNRSIGTEAKNLSTALKGDSKVQGDWGEMILQTMLERAGLQNGVHFIVQATHGEDGVLLKSETGKGLRPDVIVNLPDSRKVIIDSKVSLSAYTDYVAADDEMARKEASKRNLLSVRKHIDELADKSYQKTVKESADYVLMFIPNEGAYIAALQADGDLWQYAYERNVAIVSPTHLFSVMKIVSQLWSQDKQNRNAIKIAEKGGDLYDKLVLFVEAMQEVGVNINKAMDSFNTATNRLTSGRGNVIRLTEQLKELGAKANKSLPHRLVDNADEA